MPLEPMQVKVALEDGSYQSGAEGHAHAKPIESKGEIAGVIANLTDELVGKHGTFSQDVIEISMSAPDVPDLTVIDLPGIVRTATKGQDPTVIKDVDNLLTKYLQQPRTIILAVVPVAAQAYINMIYAWAATILSPHWVVCPGIQPSDMIARAACLGSTTPHTLSYTNTQRHYDSQTPSPSLPIEIQQRPPSHTL